MEADTVEGVRIASMAAFKNFHSRICRPVGLTEQECQKVADFAIARIGASPLCRLNALLRLALDQVQDERQHESSQDDF